MCLQINQTAITSFSIESQRKHWKWVIRSMAHWWDGWNKSRPNGSKWWDALFFMELDRFDVWFVNKRLTYYVSNRTEIRMQFLLYPFPPPPSHSAILRSTKIFETFSRCFNSIIYSYIYWLSLVACSCNLQQLSWKQPPIWDTYNSNTVKPKKRRNKAEKTSIWALLDNKRTLTHTQSLMVRRNTLYENHTFNNTLRFTQKKEHTGRLAERGMNYNKTFVKVFRFLCALLSAPHRTIHTHIFIYSFN